MSGDLVQTTSESPHADLKERDLEIADFCFDLFKDGDTMDAVYLGKFMYNCGVNPSQERLKKLGMTEKGEYFVLIIHSGTKKFKYDELLPLISELKKEVKDQGCYEDFIECLKLYDKMSDGNMLCGELSAALLYLGEKLNDAEVDELFTDCLDEEDDEGQIQYILPNITLRFLEENVRVGPSHQTEKEEACCTLKEVLEVTLLFVFLDLAEDGEEFVGLEFLLI
ncbi:hypothetical protein NQ318_000434 [Aromia moschata]|uniref:Myosin light chain alkali n=1 Tax=Aromia moschata TaxID=1265417 RepID=A0AAV8YU56_9CUCU|nr:hypothetical protein NQ318_000434 [Aromia moschata]